MRWTAKPSGRDACYRNEVAGEADGTGVVAGGELPLAPHGPPFRVGHEGFEVGHGQVGGDALATIVAYQLQSRFLQQGDQPLGHELVVGRAVAEIAGASAFSRHVRERGGGEPGGVGEVGGGEVGGDCLR
jgi:hypothetical protein